MRGMGEIRRLQPLRRGDPQAKPLAAGEPARPHRLRPLLNLAMALLLVVLLAVVVVVTDWRAVRDAAGRFTGRVIEALL